MTQHVPVGRDGLFALVDDEDFALVSRYKWYVSTEGYAVHSVWDKGKCYTLKMHRLILGLGPGDPCQADHANHDGLDNRRSNLRLATISQNAGNRRKQSGTVSRYKGVCWASREQRWRDTIRVQGKRISLGYFDAEAEAARAYDAAAVHFFGEFACLNFPDSTPAPYVPRPKPTNVCYSPSYPGPSKWRAEIQRNGKCHFVGYFLTEQAAIAALQAYKRDHNL